MSSNEIFGLRKQGKSAEALKLAREKYPENAQDLWFLRAYAWALYDHAKDLVASYDLKKLSPNALSSQLTPFMREFARIAGPLRNDTAFSQMLRLAQKVSKDWQEFLKFARWSGVDCFSDEDKTPFVNDQGKTIDSLQRRYIRAISREAATQAADPQSDPALMEWAVTILEDGLQEQPNDQWLNYYQSKLHLARGQIDRAIKCLGPVLRRQTRAAWPWALLGEILEASRPDDALICYSHAVRLAREEQEIARTRIHLARRLSLAGRYNEATEQARHALSYREQNGFKIPPELGQLLSSDWYQRTVTNDESKGLPDTSAVAKQLLEELNRQSLTYVCGVIDHINEDRALSYVATSPTAGCALSHGRFPELAGLSPGTIVEVGRAEPEGPPLDWRTSTSDTLPGLCELVSGNLERHEGKNFAFIRTGHEDVFVPPDHASGFEAGRHVSVSCLAIRRANKQGKIGWRCVRLMRQEDELDEARQATYGK